jgi:hypothetical protein
MISIRYELDRAGWADAHLSDGVNGVTVPASHVCDALLYLVDATQALFTVDASECIWIEEPGEVKWVFSRSGDLLKLRVEWWDEVATGRDEEPYERAFTNVLFEGEAKFLEFSMQVDRDLQRLLDKWGLERYLEEWGFPFPSEAHQRLRDAIAASISTAS